MLGYVINLDGKPGAFQAKPYKGYLMDVDSGLPVINQKALDTHPQKDTIKSLIDDASPAGESVLELTQDVRREEGAVRASNKGKKKRSAQDVTRRREQKDRFTDLKYRGSERFPRGARSMLDAVWKNEDAQSTFIAAPKAGRLVEKLISKDFNFTPSEVQQLLAGDYGLSIAQAYGGDDLVRALITADNTGRKVRHERQSPYIAEFLTLLNQQKTDEAMAYLASDQTPAPIHMLGYGNFYPIRKLMEANHYKLAEQMLNLLEPHQYADMKANNSKAAILETAMSGTPEAFRMITQGLPSTQGHVLLEAFKVACANDRLDIVKEALRLTSVKAGFSRGEVHIAGGRRRKMIRDGFKAACRNGHQEIVDFLKPFVRKKDQRTYVNKEKKFSAQAKPIEPLEINIELPDPDMKHVITAYPAEWVQKEPHKEFSPDVYSGIAERMVLECRLRGIDEPEKRAYALAILFEDAKEATDYINHVVDGVDAKKQGFSMASALPNAIPDEIDLKAWRRFARLYKNEAVGMLSFAKDIEAEFGAKNKKLADDKLELWVFANSTLAALKEWKALAEAKRSSGYVDLSDVPELATKLSAHNVDIGTIGRCKNAWKKRAEETLKTGGVIEDQIPDIGVIDGNNFGHPEFYMMKLPKDDPRGLVIPTFIPGTCTGPGSNLANAHMLNPEVGLYVIMRKKDKATVRPDEDRIVGKASVLFARSKKNGFVDTIAFNAWERRDEAKALCEPFYKEAAVRAMKHLPQINKVVMGKTITGYPRSEWKAFPEVSSADRVELVHESIPPGDMKRGQYLIASRTRDLPVDNTDPEKVADVGAHVGVVAPSPSKTQSSGHAASA